MSQFSDYLENAIINHFFRATPVAGPAAVYLAVSTTDPLDDGSGISEPTADPAYIRQAITFNIAVTGTARNTTAAITFPTNTTANWGTITHYAIFDAAAPGTGNMLMYGQLTTSKLVQISDTFTVNINDLEIQVS
jgi:hypothetical protein